MNQQTVAVTAGTLVLLGVGAVLLYASPGEESAAGAPAGAKVAPAKGAKGAGKAPAKSGKNTGKKVPVARLVSKRDVPADRPAAPDGAPHVVVISAAAMRRDQVTPYGGPADTMPFLADAAEGGVRFTDALANGVWAKPSQVALFTGHYPHDVGMVEPDLDKKNLRRLPQSVDTLAERFAASGWTTLGVTGSHHLTGRYGMRQGFDWYRESQPLSYLIDNRMDADDVVGAALKAVQNRAAKERPVYLQLAFVDSHKPFKVPPEEFKPFEGPGHKVAPYRATLRRQDKALEKLVTGLAKHGLTDDNTVFVFVAEHGEGLEMPMAHRKQHGLVLYDSSVSVPWVMWGAGVADGAEVAGLASQLDLAPTLLSLAGVPGPVEGLPGIDHSAAVRAGGTTTRTQHYVDTLYEGAHRASLWTATLQCQQDFGSQLDDAEGFVDGCFDRTTDPTFTTPIVKPLAQKLVSLHGERMKAVEASSQRAAADAERD